MRLLNSEYRYIDKQICLSADEFVVYRTDGYWTIVNISRISEALTILRKVWDIFNSGRIFPEQRHTEDGGND